MREVCSSCGTERQLDAKFCGNCGASFDVAANRDEGAPTTDGRTPVWVWILSAGAGLAGLLAIAFVALVLVSDSDEPVASEIFLESSTDPGENPFTPSVDTYMTGTAPTGERELDAEPAAIAAATETPAEVRTVSGAEPGVFAASGTETLCDGQALVTHLEADQERAAAWAGVIGIEPSTIPDYVGRLTPLALARDTRVTNYALVDGEAMPLDSVFEAGTTVMVDELGVPRVRCSCGNPLTAAEPVEGSVSYVGSAWSDFEPAETVSIAPAESPVAEFAVDDLSGPPEVVARLQLGFVHDVAVGHSSVWAVTGRSLFRISPETNEVEVEIPLGSEATQASVLATEDEVLVSVGHFVRDGSPVWLDLLSVNPKTNEVTSSERLFEDGAGILLRGIQAPHLAEGDAGMWMVDTGNGKVVRMTTEGEGGDLAGVSVTPDEVTGFAVTDSIWVASRFAQDALVRVDPADGTKSAVDLGADVVSALSADGDDMWAAVADESEVHDTGLRMAAGTGEILKIDSGGEVIGRFAVRDPPYGIAASDGLAWIGTGSAFVAEAHQWVGGSALIRLDPETGELSEGLVLDDPPRTIVPSDGAVWVGVSDTLLRVAPFSRTKVRSASEPLTPLEQVRTAPLTATGLGPIQVGMHVNEIESVLGTDVEWGWDFEPGEYDDEGCGVASVPVLDDMGLMMMVGGPEPRVTRVEIWGPSPGDTTPVHPVTKTDADIGIGSSETDVLAAYGPDRVEVQPHEYQDGHYMSVSAPGGKLVLFETDGSTVTAMRAGDEGWVPLIEYCA